MSAVLLFVRITVQCHFTLMYKFNENRFIGLKINEFLYVDNDTQWSIFKDSEDIWG